MTFASWPGFKHFGDFGRNGSDCFDGWKSRSKEEPLNKLNSKRQRTSHRYLSALVSTQLTLLDISLGASSIGFLRFAANILIAMPHKLVGFLQQTLGRSARLVHAIKSDTSAVVSTWACAVVSQVWQRATNLLRRFWMGGKAHKIFTYVAIKLLRFVRKTWPYAANSWQPNSFRGELITAEQFSPWNVTVLVA